MKFCFSTLGCPSWNWDEIVSAASDLGYDGIEVRGVGRQISALKAVPFAEDRLQDTMNELEQLGLEIPCLTSFCCLSNKDVIEDTMKEGKKYIDLAAKIATKFIRVIGDYAPEPGQDIDIDFVLHHYSELVNYAALKGVNVLLETNGVFADSTLMKKVMEQVDQEGGGVLWDVHHPYRFFNEPVDTTYNNLKEYIKFIHVKDSLLENGKVKYKMIGTGDVPVDQAIKALELGGYQGYVSLEWVKRWNSDLEEPYVAFPHYINYMKTLTAK